MKNALRKLLGREQGHLLVERFAALTGGDLSIGLVETDGSYLAGVTDWPESALASVEWGTLAATEEARALQGPYEPSRLLLPMRVEGELLGALVASGNISPPARELLCTLQQVIELILAQALEKRAIARETLERYREVNLLYSIGETIGACLDAEEIPRLVLGEANRVIHADAGVVLLTPAQDVVGLDASATFGDCGYPEALHEVSRHVVDHVCDTGQPAIVTDLPAQLSALPGEGKSPPLTRPLPPGGEGLEGGGARVPSASLRAGPFVAVLCAPLKTQERVLGAILLGRLAGRPVFTAGEEKLLMALAGQAGIAVENARLFADVKSQRDAIARMKNYMDNIFASIASGVITTDARDLITTLNRAAERILKVKAEETLGCPYVEVFPGVGRVIVPLVNTVRRQDEQLTGYELEPEVPHRGRVVLRLHISPLKNGLQTTTGVAIVLEDLTERRQLEQQVQQVRETFERYVAPRVVEQLLADPTNVRLGGVRREVTALFADIRGFTSFSEGVEPEFLIEVLNRHLTLAAEAVLAEEGTLDKFMGDAVLAIFNVPLPQPDHVLRAVRAALAMQRAVAEMHAHLPADERLSFGIGITTGQAVVGNVGSTLLQDYTAIGDSINLAKRLQAHAHRGQILLSAAAYEYVRGQVVGRELGLVQVKGHSMPCRVFEVYGLQESEPS